MKEKPFKVKSSVFYDNRGTFAPTPIKFNHKHPLQIRKEWLQTNISINPTIHTFRGLHYQDPLPQAKLLKVIQGSIIDFVVDLHMADFGKFYGFPMQAGEMVYVPGGFAHGFVTTEPNTIVQYMVDEDYRPEFEGSIIWSSVPEVNEALKDLDLLISDKDLNAKTLREYEIIKRVSLDEALRMAHSNTERWEIEVIDEKGNDLLVMAPNGDTQYMTKQEYELAFQSYKNKTTK